MRIDPDKINDPGLKLTKEEKLSILETIIAVVIFLIVMIVLVLGG